MGATAACLLHKPKLTQNFYNQIRLSFSRCDEIIIFMQKTEMPPSVTIEKRP